MSGVVAAASQASRYRRRALLLFFGVFAVDWADRSVLGGMAPVLKQTFSLSNTRFGLLASAFGIVSAVATLPFGVLTDRVNRMRLLAVAVLLWSVAMGATGAAVTFAMLVTARLFLGVISAAAGPAIASLTGDLVGAGNRGRVLGLIETGQLVGVGVGFLLSSFMISVLDWRFAFWLLALPGLILGWLLLRFREPRRTGAGGADTGDYRDRFGSIAGIEPDHRLVIDRDQSQCDLWTATRYVLRIRTNVIALAAGSIGHFFLGGVGTFGVLFAYEHYHLSRAAAAMLVPVLGLGAVAGMVLGGRLGDQLQRRGIIAGRIYVAAGGYLLTAALVWPAFLDHSLALAALLVPICVGTLQATQPALDAVRLDVVHPQLRGRSEAVRTVLRTGAEASAPVLFGLLADNAAGGGEAGLRVAFLVTLPALAINAGLLLLAARTYPREVAAVAASTGAHPRRRRDTHLTADHHGALDDDQPLNRPRALGSAAGCAENSGVFDGGGLAPDTSG